MSLYTITYRSAFDRQRFGDNSPIKHEGLLVGSSDWDADEVIRRYVNNNPGITVLSCTPAPQPLTA